MRNFCMKALEFKDYFRVIDILPEFLSQINVCISRIVASKKRYQAVGEVTGVPWVFVALIHEMECDCNFNRQIFNGQVWNKKTTIFPEGQGPWLSWEEAAVAALVRHTKDVKDWSIGGMGIVLESWNGWGYARHGALSPYLFSGSVDGLGCGLYVKDGKYDPNAQSKQAGAYVILASMVQRGLYVDEQIVVKEKSTVVTEHRFNDFRIIQYDEKGLDKRDVIVEYQNILNQMREKHGLDFESLNPDGWAGKKTSNAHKALTGQHLYGDPRCN